MDYESLRESMVKEQLAGRGITGKAILAAFLKVPRHAFVPEDVKSAAYEDHPLPIGEKQTISQPYIVALMSEALDIRPGDKVLEIGTGSGYQTAILLELAANVYSIERLPGLAGQAARNLEKAGYETARIRTGDGTLGWPEEAPFDRIIVAAATREAPKPLIEQLKAGGKMVIPVGEMSGQVLTLIEKRSDRIATTSLGGCVFVPLIENKTKGDAR